MGRKYFAKKLLDYEMSSNVGNWQWVAGCGVDASPYFRFLIQKSKLKNSIKILNILKNGFPNFKVAIP